MDELPEYRYGGARSMVLMHADELRRFVVTWRAAAAKGVALPPTNDPAYASLEHLLVHVVGCAAHYMTWMCKVSGRPDPTIRDEPGVEAIRGEVDAYVDHVIERWRAPLADLAEDDAYRPAYPSQWVTPYCIDAMLEHAVMHPFRHRVQLENLLARP